MHTQKPRHKDSIYRVARLRWRNWQTFPHHYLHPLPSDFTTEERSTSRSGPRAWGEANESRLRPSSSEGRYQPIPSSARVPHPCPLRGSEARECTLVSAPDILSPSPSLEKPRSLTDTTPRSRHPLGRLQLAPLVPCASRIQGGVIGHAAPLTCRLRNKGVWSPITMIRNFGTDSGTRTWPLPHRPRTDSSCLVRVHNTNRDELSASLSISTLFFGLLGLCLSLSARPRPNCRY